MASKAGGKAADRRAASPGSARREPEGHIRMYSGEGCLLTLCSFRGPILRHNAQVLIALGEPPLVLGAGRSTGAGGLAAVRPFTELRFDGNGGPFACIDILPTHPAWRVFQQIAGDGVMWLPPERYGAWIRRLRE
ncbi:hypothetical protein, partial [Eleftheria terrae]|uniref:hypothetical protein n=1 Tax=Eleftheria terrae TaxID=1597781 RepID=UPI00263B89A7